jgi:hypothetical protein
LSPKDSLTTAPGQSGGSETCAPSNGHPDDPYFARLPHGIASDTRLTPTARLLTAALLYWGLKGRQCEVSDWKLADYLGIKPRAVQKALRALERFGYVECVRCRPRPGNMTGRVIARRWLDDPSIVPTPPRWDAKPGEETRPAEALHSGAHPPGEGLHSRTDRVRTPGQTGCALQDREGLHSGAHKEDRVVEPPKNPPRTAPDPVRETTRPGAGAPLCSEGEGESEWEPLGAPAILEARREKLRRLQAEAEARCREDADPGPDASSPTGPSEPRPRSLGQLKFLGALTPAERARFDALPDAARAKMLAAHERGLDPLILADQKAKLSPRPEPGPAIPDNASLAEVIAALPGNSDPAAVQRATEALVRELGDNARLWPFHRQLVHDVWSRTIPPEAIVEPLARLQEKLAAGGVSGPGRYFHTSVKNWLVEKGRPIPHYLKRGAAKVATVPPLAVAC